MRLTPLFVILLFLPLSLSDSIRQTGRTWFATSTGPCRPCHGSFAAGYRVGAGDAEAQQLLCRVALQIERWDAAVAACEKAVYLDSGSSDNHLWYGRALGEKADRASFIKAYGLAKRVKAEFETVVSLDPL